MMPIKLTTPNIDVQAEFNSHYQHAQQRSRSNLAVQNPKRVMQGLLSEMENQNQENNKDSDDQSAHDLRQLLCVDFIGTPVFKPGSLRQNLLVCNFLYIAENFFDIDSAVDIAHDTNGADSVPVYNLSLGQSAFTSAICRKGTDMPGMKE